MVIEKEEEIKCCFGSQLIKERGKGVSSLLVLGEE
jgi:hypothetical protein